ncbi:MAG: HNH endonuclease signature motif containing protein [Alphaproteobacteria bacterium]
MSRRTPADIARQLRREAGFGCCICGNPIFQYHHIIEWKDDQHHRPEDMMVLCPNHHDQATKGAMTEAEQRKFKASPRNIQDGLAKGRLAVRQNYCAASFGSVTVVGEGPFLRMADEDIIEFSLGEDGNLELSIKLYSENDDLLLKIERNEWTSCCVNGGDVSTIFGLLRTDTIKLELNWTD